MTFTRKSADITPIVDTVFAIVAKASEDKKINGDIVVDATIGSLYGEDEKLVAYDCVFDHYDAIDHRTKARYAASFTGNANFRKGVYDWVMYKTGSTLAHSVIATPGGTGAVSIGFTSFLDENETVILPDIAWGSYKLMASENNLRALYYKNFDQDRFNLASLKECVEAVKKEQDRIVIVVNDPCHNPTGYSMSLAEWKQLIAYLNEVSKTHHVILINDIAYIDYAFQGRIESRSYMGLFNDISDTVMVEICFSCSKMLTSYGLRCGAAILLSQKEKDVRDVEIIMEKKARATWSNIPNAAMENFVWAITEGKDLFLQEKEAYVKLLKERSDLFLQEAKECDLPCYPYKEGFFITLQIEDNALRHTYHQALMDNHIYTVEVNHGIRIAICSLPMHKAKGLALRMKEILRKVQ